MFITNAVPVLRFFVTSISDDGKKKHSEFGKVPCSDIHEHGGKKVVAIKQVQWLIHTEPVAVSTPLHMY